ncbi:hypothetical protein EON80_17910 [bacterium]|nr:MAG: hypothetical protein EON80_17910 [bacterium]
MALAIGFLLFLLGLVTFVGWWPETIPFWKGFTSLSLLFWGLLALIVGYSERKAKREFAKAVNDDSGDSEAVEKPKEQEETAKA